MNFSASVASIDDLVAWGLPPAEAAALHIVAGIALNCVASNCNHLFEHGATDDEVAAYREPALDDMAAWVLRHVPTVTNVLQGQPPAGGGA